MTKPTEKHTLPMKARSDQGRLNSWLDLVRQGDVPGRHRARRRRRWRAGRRELHGLRIGYGGRRDRARDGVSLGRGAVSYESKVGSGKLASGRVGAKGRMWQMI